MHTVRRGGMRLTSRFLNLKGFISRFINGIEYGSEGRNRTCQLCVWTPCGPQHGSKICPENEKTRRHVLRVATRGQQQASLGHAEGLRAGRHTQVGLRLPRAIQERFGTPGGEGTHFETPRPASGLIFWHQRDSFGMPEKQKAPETLGSRGFLRQGSGRYRT